MPIFDAKCKQCGEISEIIVLCAEDDHCPVCESADITHLPSCASFKIAPRKFEIKHGPSHNPYDNLTLHHVRGEDGKPIKVNSERELRAAEKRHNFVHAASWGLEDAPPQHEPDAGDITRKYKKKFNRDPVAYKRPDAFKGVSAGIAAQASDTLAGKPNPL